MFTKKTSTDTPTAPAPESKTIDTTRKAVSTSKNVAADDSTQRYLPFAEIRDNVMYMKDGSARMIIAVQPVNFSLKSEQEQDAIIYSYQRFLNSLRFPVQILVRSLKVDIEGYVTKLQNLASTQKNVLLKEQTLRYIDFLGNLVDVAQIMKKEFYISIPHNETEDLGAKRSGMVVSLKNFVQSVFSQGQDITKVRTLHKRLDSMKKKMYEKSSLIRSSLESIGLRSHVLEKNELIDLLMSYNNPKTDTVAKLGDTVDTMDLSDT